ncbi:hypothetical protein GCM10023169_38500 [Georgenia halophila]|uniref:Uncharacterized protein n=1 Tax=Georgenia halophila TaxID=620889 RepID=A0ABP8LMI3_9MICO
MTGPTATAEMLNRVVPTLVRVARRPGAVLLTIAGTAVGLFALLGLLLATGATAWTGWIPFGVAVVLALPVLVLAVRRARLQARTRDLDVEVVRGSSGAEVVVLSPGEGGPGGTDPSRRDTEEEQAVLDAAAAENAIRTARFFPRLEAAQRAARVAAGGTVNAPYLADDVRVTVVALVGTLAAIPLGFLGAFVTMLMLAG